MYNYKCKINKLVKVIKIITKKGINKLLFLNFELKVKIIVNEKIVNENRLFIGKLRFRINITGIKIL